MRLHIFSDLIDSQHDKRRVSTSWVLHTLDDIACLRYPVASFRALITI
jgi:hypothetical protein